jgi:two-component system, OmpR family, sensor kinase
MTHSLRGRLFIGLGLFIAAASVAAGIFAFRFTFNEALEMQDGMLIQIGAAAVNVPLKSDPASGHDLEAETRIVIEDADAVSTNEADRRAMQLLPDGLHTIARPDETWRILLRTRPDGSRLLVAQATQIRDDIARASAFDTVLPLAALIPCLMLVVAIIIRQSLRPMILLARDVDLRQAHDLEMLPLASTPRELHPFIHAINRLLDRVRVLVDAQRRFIADASHELRTPITAISLQAENLDKIDLPLDARERLTALRQGAIRTRKLLEHLLALARYDVGSPAELPITDLAQCAKVVVGDLLPQALCRNIDLGFEAAESVAVTAEPVALEAVIRNLLDNALRYTPLGGHVDVCIYREHSQAVLSVEDSGPGIPAAELDRVFTPFFRGGQASQESGAGLGLAIVKRIVERLDGIVTLESATEGTSGLRVCVQFPVAKTVNPTQS